MLSGLEEAEVSCFSLLRASVLLTELPLRTFNYTEYNFDPTINAVSTIFVVLALVLIIALGPADRPGPDRLTAT